MYTYVKSQKRAFVGGVSSVFIYHETRAGKKDALKRRGLEAVSKLKSCKVIQIEIRPA